MAAAEPAAVEPAPPDTPEARRIRQFRRARQSAPGDEAGETVATAGRRSPGATGTLPGTTRFRFAGHRIVESWMTWDEAGVLQRLGLVGADRAGSTE
jgi:hypothetical protein